MRRCTIEEGLFMSIYKIISVILLQSVFEKGKMERFSIGLAIIDICEFWCSFKWRICQFHLESIDWWQIKRVCQIFNTLSQENVTLKKIGKIGNPRPNIIITHPQCKITKYYNVYLT